MSAYILIEDYYNKSILAKQCKYNPFAICNAQQNKTGMSDAKKEKCIKDLKKKCGWK